MSGGGRSGRSVNRAISFIRRCREGAHRPAAASSASSNGPSVPGPTQLGRRRPLDLPGPGRRCVRREPPEEQRWSQADQEERGELFEGQERVVGRCRLQPGCSASGTQGRHWAQGRHRDSAYVSNRHDKDGQRALFRPRGPEQRELERRRYRVCKRWVPTSEPERASARAGQECVTAATGNSPLVAM